jgi:hypothetical protein
VKGRLVCIGVFLILSACAKTTVIELGDRSYVSRTRPVDIEIYINEPKRDYVEVAYVEVDGAYLSSSSKAREDIKKKASQLGGDAIILNPTKKETEFNPFSGIETRKKTRAVVIRFQ